MSVQEEERTRLSRELHDQIGQALATLRLEITRAESLPARDFQDIRQRLAGARALAESMIQTVRDISLLLRPSLLDDLGLAPALQWQVEEFRRRTGLPCEFSEHNVEGPLPESVRTCVYRVLQEALHNCEKHAAASAVSVSVCRFPELLTLEVEDDGKGFDTAGGPSRTRPGFGMLGMRERAAALGGTLAVTSSPGNGARLTLRLPLTKAADSREISAAVKAGV